MSCQCSTARHCFYCLVFRFCCLRLAGSESESQIFLDGYLGCKSAKDGVSFGACECTYIHRCGDGGTHVRCTSTEFANKVMGVGRRGYGGVGGVCLVGRGFGWVCP